MYGIEIEFAAPKTKFNSTLRKKGFFCGTDCTASLIGLEGREARHINPVKWNDDDVENLRFTLNFIKQKGGRIHKMCGLHFHFSGFGPINMAKFSRLMMGYKSLNWKSRDSYCRGEFGKYCIIRHINDDHYECRCFNGTLSLRAICQYKKILDDIIMRSKS